MIPALPVSPDYFTKNWEARPWVDPDSVECPAGSCTRRGLTRSNVKKAESLNKVPREHRMLRRAQEVAPIQHDQRRLEFSTDAITDILGVLADVMGAGELVVPYCFGDCPDGNSSKRLSGQISMTCDA